MGNGDIDSDFCIYKGQLVFKHLIEKYGRGKCCNILVFGRMQTKAVIKDLAKALGIPFDEVNAFTRILPAGVHAKGFHVTDILENPEYNQHPFVINNKELLEHAALLEGSPRHVSQHPAGIAVLPTDVTTICPTMQAKAIEMEDGSKEANLVGYLSQVEKDQAEQLGLIKLDILRLRNVSEIDIELKEINKLYGTNLTTGSIPLDDEKVWDEICKLNTLGIFQFDSNVSVPVLTQIQPRNIEELSAANAFVRPGASGLDEYVKGKKNPKNIRTFHPNIDRHLRETFGGIVYQEQIMFLIAEILGIGFGEADIYRRALEKPNKGKNAELVKKFSEEIVLKAAEQGISEETALALKELIIENSGYGFNKSHAVCYAIIAYWTAWIKVNYPLVFYKTMFNGNIVTLNRFMSDAKRHGITVLPPHVRHSEFLSTIVDKDKNVIRLGFNCIKGVGEVAVDFIVDNRPYNTINDFFEKNPSKSTNKKVVEGLIDAGAFDDVPLKIDSLDDISKIKFNIANELVLNRFQLRKWYDYFIEYSAQKSVPNFLINKSFIKQKYFDLYELQEEENGNIVIPECCFDALELNREKIIITSKLADLEKTRKKPKGKLKDIVAQFKEIPKYELAFTNNIKEILDIKFDILKAYILEKKNNDVTFISHPLSSYEDKIKPFDTIPDGITFITIGLITGLFEKISKAGNKYYQLTVNTPYETVTITLWQNQLKKYNELLKINKPVAIKGTKGYGGMTCLDLKELTKF